MSIFTSNHVLTSISLGVLTVSAMVMSKNEESKSNEDGIFRRDREFEFEGLGDFCGPEVDRKMGHRPQWGRYLDKL